MELLCQIFLKTHQIIHCHCSDFFTIWQNFGWLQCQCWWWWCVCLLDWLPLEPVIPPRQLCVCCGVPARPNRLRHSGCDHCPAAEAASRAAYSPASSLSFSQYNYLIITLQDWTVCLEKYRGASDVNIIIGPIDIPPPRCI